MTRKTDLQAEAEALGLDFEQKTTIAQLEAMIAEAQEEDAVEEAEEAVEEAPRKHFSVFYRELTPTGRDGAEAHRDFTSEKDAESFAEEVGGRIR